MSSISVEAEGTRELRPIAQSDAQQTFEIPTWGNPVTVTVPRGFSATFREGPDFDVCYFSTSDQSGTVFGIYFGTSPDTRWPKGATETPGRVGGKQIAWHDWKEKQDGVAVFHREGIIRGVLDKVTLIHIFISSESQDMVNKLAESASSLRRKH